MRVRTKKLPTKDGAVVAIIYPGAETLQFAVTRQSADALRTFIVSLMQNQEYTPKSEPNVSWRTLAEQTGDLEHGNRLSEIALTVRAYRKKQGMTQSELAAKLGCKQANVSAIEKGARPIGVAMAKKLAKLFAVDVSLFI